MEIRAIIPRQNFVEFSFLFYFLAPSSLTFIDVSNPSFIMRDVLCEKIALK